MLFFHKSSSIPSAPIVCSLINPISATHQSVSPILYKKKKPPPPLCHVFPSLILSYDPLLPGCLSFSKVSSICIIHLQDLLPVLVANLRVLTGSIRIPRLSPTTRLITGTTNARLTRDLLPIPRSLVSLFNNPMHILPHLSRTATRPLLVHVDIPRLHSREMYPVPTGMVSVTRQGEVKIECLSI